ncbi:MAG: hypothetical protein DIU70_003600 [Bacillota bacterium]|nr:MAG: hypothetical protein DIU70_03955 [Bacillota bacterium]
MLPEWFLALSAWVVAVTGLLALVLLGLWLFWQLFEQVRVLRAFGRAVLDYAVDRKRREQDGRRVGPPPPSPSGVRYPRRSLD